jgi:hypothetical protein
MRSLRPSVPNRKGASSAFFHDLAVFIDSLSLAAYVASNS